VYTEYTLYTRYRMYTQYTWYTEYTVYTEPSNCGVYTVVITFQGCKVLKLNTQLERSSRQLCRKCTNHAVASVMNIYMLKFQFIFVFGDIC